jgi:1,4-alpha-glucan branching enzyme
VGKFQLTLNSPVENSTNIVNSGANISVTASTSLPSTFKLKANGATVNSTSVTATTYSYSYNVTQDAVMELEATNASDLSVQTKNFVVATTPNVQTAAIPSWIRQGINYDANDATKIGLAIYAPGKSYVHVIGSFNQWAVNSNYLMKKDTTNPDLYWIEITGLTPQQIYTFQYRTNDGIKVADPYSRLVLSPDDDPYISSADYPNLPAYPSGQKFDVSVVQTGMSTYNWQATNFTKPAKENLVVYEALVRDFTSEQNWQSMIDKISYFKNLKINAIELMPVMEFDGNNSWGYNPSFHFALDKAYGTSDKFKEFIDTCHQNGIAVILDIALNHATQRNPLVRLWNTDPDGDGYGSANSSNPYFNTVAKHAYNVNEDMNHSTDATRYYVGRVLEQWISEYKIDGFRWDLTKGFTQNCTASDESCTGSYQQDRVDVLKLYADKQWSLDPSSYVIFEHLGTDNEEKEWANYRVGEGKGVILWDNLNGPYNQNTMGYTTDSTINRADFENHVGFTERRNITYGESHDERD